MKALACFLAVCSSAILCLAVMPGAASALSDAEYKKMLASSPEFASADKRLNTAWGALRKAVSGERIEQYRKFQRR
ncbi:MAG: hypothetical protein LBR87_04905 [Synergistaceae bacterium]|nr:hypothetical protein [Synergistaceae bacterium]